MFVSKTCPVSLAGAANSFRSCRALAVTVTLAWLLLDPLAEASTILGQPADSGSISGYVTTMDGEALPEARLSLYELNREANDRKARLLARQSADDTGEYRFAHLPAGFYMVEAWLEGFAEARIWDVYVNPNEGRTLDLALPLGNFGIKRSAVLSGLVRAENGEALSDVRLTFRDAFNAGILVQQRTNKEGRFELEPVFCGTYVILAFKPGFEVASKLKRIGCDRPEILDLTLKVASDQ